MLLTMLGCNGVIHNQLGNVESGGLLLVCCAACRTITGCGGLQNELQALWGFPYWGPPGFNRQVISGPSWGDFRSFTVEGDLATFLKNSDQ
jgi:hypothetical protein